jgi:predicted DCC family thiol-disulfide oxidoreductase YuxK
MDSHKKILSEQVIVTKPIVLYDGVCGLCNRLVQFLLGHDKHDRLRFASLQSDFAAKVLGRHGIDPSDLDTVHVVENYEQAGEQVLNRSDAVLRAGHELGGIWTVAATIGKILPRALRDLAYRFVARNRYRVFGKYDTCMLPEPQQRKKFLDM